MSQFDFGTIDPQVRDGAWLADSLNQWRDAIYSQYSGSTAPSYAVNGLIWRDTAGGASITTVRMREFAAWHDLFTIEADGSVTFANTLKATGDTITGTLELTGNPGLTSTSPIGIGAGPFDSQSDIHVRATAGNAALKLEALAASQLSMLLLRAGGKMYDIASDGIGFWCYDYQRSTTLFKFDANGVLSVGPGGPFNGRMTVYDPALAMVQILSGAATADYAQLKLTNALRTWSLNSSPTGTFQIGDDTGGASRLEIGLTGQTAVQDLRSNTNVYTVGNVYARDDVNFALTGGSNFHQLQFYSGWNIAVNTVDQGMKFHLNDAERLAIFPSGNYFFNGVPTINNFGMPRAPVSASPPAVLPDCHGALAVIGGRLHWGAGSGNWVRIFDDEAH